MNHQDCPSLVAMFFDQAKRLDGKPFLWAKHGGHYQPFNWNETARQVDHLARGMVALGVKRGDRVLLVAENRPEWAIADLAIMAAGGITVPAYVTNTIADHLHVLNNSGAQLAIVSTKALAERLVPACFQASRPCQVIAIENLGSHQLPVPVHGWTEIIAQGGSGPDTTSAIIAQTRREDTACLIYTSGTGGAPKGVMLSHGAILHNAHGAYCLLREMGLSDEVFLSFLPLSHSYEHTAGLHFPISIGAQIYYAEGVETLAANMLEARPTIMTAVPRLYETMRGKILKGVDRQGGLKAKLFHRALELGSKRITAPESLSLTEKLENLVLDRLVRAKVKARFGGRLKAMVSGGAPLNYEVGLFFTALGVRILQGYGQTESAPVISCNPPSKIKLDTVGPPLDGVEVKIAADGEILVRGELVMQGYWNDPQASAAAIGDGRWLHTGDIGEMDQDHYIRITDRKKDIIVNSGGDNLSPARIEGFLTLEPEIGQAMVFGDKRPHLVALLVPDQDFVIHWARANNKPADIAALAQDSDFRKKLSEVVDKVNRNLSAIEKVRRFVIAGEPFSIANEMLTPTLKIRRHKIREAYGAELERLYAK